MHQTITCARTSLWNFLAGIAEPMTQIASPTQMALPRRLTAAQKATNQSKVGKTLKLLVPSRVRALLWRIVKIYSRVEVLKVDPRGKITTNTINRAELVRVQAWLKQVSQQESPPATTFKLLTDSQVEVQSIQKAIKQPATTWLCTHEPLLTDIVAK